MLVKLTQDKYALVDDEDYEWLNQWKWQYCNGYASRSRNKITMHTAIVKKYNLGEIIRYRLETDHIDRNKLNNQKSNLRVVTRTKQRWNTIALKNNKSGFKGVDWVPRDQTWRAGITVNGKRISLGPWKTKKAAALAYKLAERKYFIFN
jgi:hypothetical protein